MNVLIIGGTGVLGTALTTEALLRGHDVVTIGRDRGLVSTAPPQYWHLQVDRNDSAALRNALDTIGVGSWDLVVDIICYNHDHARSLLDIIDGRSKHTVVMSTTLVYDCKSTMPHGPQSPIASIHALGGYAGAKADMERVWNSAYATSRHPVTILRLPHVVGCGCELGAVPLHNRDPALIARLRAGDPLILADGGRQLLHIVHARDVAEITLAVAGADATIGKTYNCANPDMLTGRMYYELVADVLGVEPVFCSIPAEAICASEWGWALTAVSRVLDMGSLQADIGVVPATTARIGIAEVVAFCLQRQGRADGPNDTFCKLESELEMMYSQLSATLSRCTPSRLSTDVDLRMNKRPLSAMER